MYNLYNRLKELCDKKGVSLAKMCLEAGISKSTTTELKMGRSKTLSSAAMVKVANYFGVTVAYLLGEEDQKEKPTVKDGELTDGEKLLLDMFRRVPEDKQELVLQMIRVALGSQE